MERGYASKKPMPLQCLVNYLVKETELCGCNLKEKHGGNKPKRKTKKAKRDISKTDTLPHSSSEDEHHLWISVKRADRTEKISDLGRKYPGGGLRQKFQLWNSRMSRVMLIHGGTVQREPDSPGVSTFVKS